MIILDTDCLSLMERARILDSSGLRKELEKFHEDDIFTTIISFEEQMRGWLAVIARCKTPEDEIFGYEMLHKLLENYRNTQVLGYDEAAVVEFVKLKAAKIRVGTMDLKIAIIAIANNAILVTRNLVDFERIPGLNIQDWTV